MGQKRTPKWIKIAIAIIIILLIVDIILNVCFGIPLDPFDRLLICQAQAEGLTLVSADENIRKYDVKTLWKD